MTIDSNDSYKKKLKLSVFYACTLYSDSLTATISNNYNILKNKIKNKIKHHNIKISKTTLSTMSSCQYSCLYLKITKKWQLQKLIVAVKLIKKFNVDVKVSYPITIQELS